MSGPSRFKEVYFLVGMYKVPLEGGGLYQLEPGQGSDKNRDTRLSLQASWEKRGLIWPGNRIRDSNSLKTVAWLGAPWNVEATRELWVQRKCLGLATWESIEGSKLLRQGPWEPEQRTLCHKLSCQAR